MMGAARAERVVIFAKIAAVLVAMQGVGCAKAVGRVVVEFAEIHK